MIKIRNNIVENPHKAMIEGWPLMTLVDAVIPEHCKELTPDDIREILYIEEHHHGVLANALADQGLEALRERVRWDHAEYEMYPDSECELFREIMLNSTQGNVPVSEEILVTDIKVPSPGAYKYHVQWVWVDDHEADYFAIYTNIKGLWPILSFGDY